MNQNNRSRSLPAGFGGVPMQVLLAAVLLLVGLGGAGWLLVNRHRSASRTEADLALQSIAELKAREIAAWMKDRRGDATILASSLRLGQFLASPRDPGLRADTLAYFQALQRAYDYALVALFDAQGRLLLTTSTNVLSQYSCVASHVGMAQLRTRILDTDLHRGGPAEPIHLSFLTPIRGPGQTNGPANGVVLLLVDPQRFLFPFLRHWPTPSPSGETVLLRREGADVVYLNETRHRPGTALNLRLPAVELGLPATPPGPEEAGRFNGRDYRQIPVTAAVQAVPDTPWIVEAKLDREEIEAPIRRDTWQTALALGLAALAVVLGLGLRWRQQRLRFIEDELMERKRLEQELHEALIKYRTLFDIFPLGVTVANREGRILESNSAANAILGISTSEQQRRGIASPDWKIVRPDQTPMPVEEFASVRALRDQRVVENVEMGLVRSPTETTWISVTAAPVPLPDVALVITYSDVSEHKRLEDQLRQLNQELEERVAVRTRALAESELRFRTLIRTSRDAILTSDFEGNLLDANPAAVAMFGYPDREQLLAASLAALFPELQPDGRPSPDLVAANRHTILTQGSASFECVHRRADGTPFPAEVSVSLADVEGKPVFHSITRDVSERRRAEAQLRKLGSALEQSPIAVLITDHKTRIEYVNPCFERETGYSAAEVVGCNPRLLRSGIHTPEFYAAMWQRLTAGQTWRGEICNQRKDGSRYWAASAITPLCDPAGQITHFVSIQEDITERRRVAGELQQAMEKAEAANRAKSVFLANMSHEIRTPLNAVLGFTQLLLREPDATPRQRQRLTAIGRSGEHLLNIINDIVEMARIESGRLTLNPSIFSPTALMQDLESMFVLRAQQEELAFTVATDPGLPAHLRADETKLRQVLINLLGNAFKFTPAHGRVALRLHLDPAGTEDRRWLRFEVEDNGPGVEPAEAARIFEPFYQTRAGQAAGGTGLGLPISRQIARHMGGDLTLTTEPGRGCRFVFTTSVEIPGHLPPESAPATAPAPVLAPECRGCPVLVVDDVAENREVLAALLTSAGFAVRVAVSGHEAIAACATALPRLVILDLRMPGLDGFEVARTLRAQHGPDTRILVLSASVDNQACQDSLAAGADAFMGKPFRDADLLECIRRLTGVAYHPAGAASAPDVTPPGPRGPTRDALQKLPDDLLQALRHAVAAANHGELLALVDRTAAHDATLGAQLRDLAERYDNETLHHLLAPDSSTL